MNNFENNENIIKFATELSELTGRKITVDHIHEGHGRFYYIQAPDAGAPMLLHHYRSPFFVDIHPDDLQKLETGEISAYEYITTANWQVGYYWGGGSMVGGGYYQPMDIVHDTDKVRRYLQILSCRGWNLSSGYKPSAEECSKCPVEKCPFSQHKDGGNWDNEVQEYDPRVDLFHALARRFQQEFPDFRFSGFYAADLADRSVILSPNAKLRKNEKFSFSVFASEETIKSLLMRKECPSDWDAYAEEFEFTIHPQYSALYMEVNEENLKEAFKDLDYSQNQTEAKADETEEVSKEENTGLIARLLRIFKK